MPNVCEKMSTVVGLFVLDRVPKRSALRTSCSLSQNFDTAYSRFWPPLPKKRWRSFETKLITTHHIAGEGPLPRLTLYASSLPPQEWAGGRALGATRRNSPREAVGRPLRWVMTSWGSSPSRSAGPRTATTRTLAGTPYPVWVGSGARGRIRLTNGEKLRGHVSRHPPTQGRVAYQRDRQQWTKKITHFGQ